MNRSRNLRGPVTLAFAAVGALNLYPLVGVLGSDRLIALYGIDRPDGDLALLLRHRAVLLGIVGSMLLAAAIRPALRRPAALAALVSMLSFVLLAAVADAPGAPLLRVMWADVVGSVVLLAAVAASSRVAHA